MRQHTSPLFRRALAGAIGGLAGTLIMNYAQRAWTRASGDRVPESAAGKHDARDWQERDEHQNSNELAAQTVAGWFTGRPLTREELRIAAPAIHFAFGALAGAVYGIQAGRHADQSRSGAGFGTALWLAADEVAMPLLGLSGPATQRPASMHLQSLASHLAYGFSAELVRSAAQKRLDGTKGFSFAGKSIVITGGSRRGPSRAISGGRGSFHAVRRARAG
jgi:putative membrane protein